MKDIMAPRQLLTQLQDTHKHEAYAGQRVGVIVCLYRGLSKES